MSNEQITLTGATLDRHHGHSHSHGGHCSHNHGSGSGGNVEMMTTDMPMQMEEDINPSIEEVVNSSTSDIVKSLATLLRFGRYEALQPLLEALVARSPERLPDIFAEMDEGGHSILHWAAKRVDDIRFLNTLLEILGEFQLTVLLNAASKDNVGMTPLHWACTESSIPHVALLWKKGADVEARDASGCTPLLIAAQYGQVDVVAYLLKHGARIQAVDTSKDTALHWAAYKGSIQVCGLLAFYETLSFTTTDNYGQTPLHLAALRGHTSVVRYILVRLTKKEKEMLFLKDKNGRTPLDLAIHKNRPNVQVVLKEAMAAVEDPRGHFLRKTMWTQLLEFASPKAWKQWMGMTPGMDELDAPMKAPFYYLLANFGLHFVLLFGAFAPVFHAEKGLLWDKSGWILINVVWMTLSWYFFYKTYKTSPGYLDEKNPHIDTWRRKYEETLEAYAELDDKKKIESLPPLCHTCHVARPLRSKHCRVNRKCVLVFDHYCPFVDNTVGLYNYRYFYFFLMTMTFALCTFVITLIIYSRRYKAENSSLPWMTLLLGLEVGICLLPVAGMLMYHTQLSMVNLTTNEHMNVRKYKYLFPTVNGHRRYRNPWFKGWMGNMMDRMQPSDACYIIPKEHEPLQSTNSSGEENV